MAAETDEALPDPEAVASMMRDAVKRSRAHARTAQDSIERSIFRTGVDRVDFHVGNEERDGG